MSDLVPELRSRGFDRVTLDHLLHVAESWIERSTRPAQGPAASGCDDFAICDVPVELPQAA